MKRWMVVTPDYETYSFNGIDPPEYGADVIEIEAETKRDAIRLGVVEMLKGGRFSKYSHGYSYCRDQRSDNASPYTGVWAEEIPEGSDEEPSE